MPLSVSEPIVNGDRWEAVRCHERDARLFDVNRARREIKILCDKCRLVHTIALDTLLTPRPVEAHSGRGPLRPSPMEPDDGLGHLQQV
jgi:hypothetical protein